MPTKADAKQIEMFLTRGVERVYPSVDFVRKRLQEGEPLTMYLGIDPTAPSLHLGHAIVLLKLRSFQEMGHKVALLIGDFTGMIGDPTDKSATRTRLTREEVLNNAQKYEEQAGTILDFDGDNPAVIKYNSEWLDALSFQDVVELSANFTVQQMLQRDMFQRRLDNEKPIYLHEFLYPLMQAYDCVAMDVDGEIGGNDQTFNMLAGRTLMKELKNKEKFVVAMRLLTDSTGMKMGKTAGNMARLDDAPDDMFGQVMSWPDTMIVSGFELLTRMSKDEIEKIAKRLEEGTNPKDAKMRLAREIVSLFHDEKAAQAASEQFDKVFSKHEEPEEMDEFAIATPMSILDVLNESGLTSSKSEARRVIDQGGVSVDDEKIDSYDTEITLGDTPVVIQKGKRHFLRIISE